MSTFCTQYSDQSKPTHRWTTGKTCVHLCTAVRCSFVVQAWRVPLLFPWESELHPWSVAVWYIQWLRKWCWWRSRALPSREWVKQQQNIRILNKYSYAVCGRLGAYSCTVLRLFIGPIANLKGPYFQPSLSVCVCVCVCVSDWHFYPSTLTDFDETWSQGLYCDLVWPQP